MDNLEYRFSPQAILSDSETIAGYGVVFYDGGVGTEYQLGSNLFERIHPNAFDESLTKGNIVLQEMHRREAMIARQPKTLHVSKDSRGIAFKTTKLNSNSAKEVIAKIKDDVYQGASGGFYVQERRFAKESGKDIVWVMKAHLKEISIVDTPAYHDCAVSLRFYEEWKSQQSKEYEDLIRKYRELIDRYS